MNYEYTQSNIKLFRVECPKCKSRRLLNEKEISDALNHGEYEAYQLCSMICIDRCSEEEFKKASDSKLKTLRKVLNIKPQN